MMPLKAQNALVNSSYCVTERISWTIAAVDLNVCGSGMKTSRQKTDVQPLAETSCFMRQYGSLIIGEEKGQTAVSVAYAIVGFTASHLGFQLQTLLQKSFMVTKKKCTNPLPRP